MGKHLFDFSAILQNDELGTSNLVLTQRKTLSRPDVLTNLPKTKSDVLTNLPKTKSDVLTNPPKTKTDVLTNLPNTKADVLTNLPKTKVHWVSDFFDLMWPKQSQIKSSPNYLSGIQRGFC